MIEFGVPDMSDMDCDEIYGVNISKKITPIMIREAIIVCFYEAHSLNLEEMKNHLNFKDDIDFENFKRNDVEALIKLKFEEVGGDFNNPSKDSLIEVVKKLKDYSKFFRDQRIIEKHANDIMKLIDKLN